MLDLDGIIEGDRPLMAWTINDLLSPVAFRDLWRGFAFNLFLPRALELMLVLQFASGHGFFRRRSYEPPLIWFTLRNVTASFEHRSAAIGCY
jgi:hypothetical protein